MIFYSLRPPALCMPQLVIFYLLHRLRAVPFLRRIDGFCRSCYGGRSMIHHLRPIESTCAAMERCSCRQCKRVNAPRSPPIPPQRHRLSAAQACCHIARDVSCRLHARAYVHHGLVPPLHHVTRHVTVTRGVRDRTADILPPSVGCPR